MTGILLRRCRYLGNMVVTAELKIETC